MSNQSPAPGTVLADLTYLSGLPYVISHEVDIPGAGARAMTPPSPGLDHTTPLAEAAEAEVWRLAETFDARLTDAEARIDRVLHRFD